MGPTSRSATPTTATKDCVPAAFDPVADEYDLMSRAGYWNVRTEAMNGWQRGITHTFRAEAPLS